MGTGPWRSDDSIGLTNTWRDFLSSYAFNLRIVNYIRQDIFNWVSSQYRTSTSLGHHAAQNTNNNLQSIVHPSSGIISTLPPVTLTAFLPTKQRITILNKRGKRSIANLDEMYLFLKMTFPTIDVELITLKALGSWSSEISYLRETTVLITTSGSIGLSALFLPPGATVILVDTYDLQREMHVGQDEVLWDSLGHVNILHYPFVKLEVQLAPHLDRSRVDDMREYGNVKINLERIASLVTAALKHVANFMTMTKADHMS